MTSQLELCINAALLGGNTARNTGINGAEIKAGFIGGNQEIQTPADIASQIEILNYLAGNDSKAYFLTEEKVDNKELTSRIITKDKLKLLENNPVYVIDPICGSSSHNAGHWEWATGVGYMENLELKAGASFAPHIFGGALYYAAKDQGAFSRMGISFDAGMFPQEIKVNSRPINESYVIFGPDCVLNRKYPNHAKLMTSIAPEIRTINMNGSCVQPLAALAGGSFQALVEPLQAPWDYTSGRIILEEAGGHIQFYEMDSTGKPTKRINHLELKHYDPSVRAVAFIAGADPEITDYLTTRLFKL